jgi:DNA-directed RNA polymerase subunit M/transcription elongation factor TFIIS
MAAPGIRITCPNCQQQMAVPEAVRGKKVRCKKCGGVVPVPAGGVDTRVRTEQAQAKATTKAVEEEEGLAKDPYGVTETSLAPRCPHCAYELDPPDSRICLHCGYDMIHRQRRPSIKTYDRTGGDWFWWLLPGVACLLGFFLIIAFGIYYHFFLPSDLFNRWEQNQAAANGDRFKTVEKTADESYWVYIFHPGIEVWLYVFFLWLMWKSGKFAVKRLVLNYMPPEKIKEK